MSSFKGFSKQDVDSKQLKTNVEKLQNNTFFFFDQNQGTFIRISWNKLLTLFLTSQDNNILISYFTV